MTVDASADRGLIFVDLGFVPPVKGGVYRETLYIVRQQLVVAAFGRVCCLVLDAELDQPRDACLA
jgi:hypothetical protein